MDIELTTAWRLHQESRHADAARCYHGVVEREPGNAEARHLYGILHHQNGYHARAVELIEQAIALSPAVPAYHANLAEAYRALGQNDRAVACCRFALCLQPNYPEAANNLGLALFDLGRHAEAVEQYRAALRMWPEFATAQNNLGNALRELGQVEEALEAFRAALALDPSLTLAHSNLGQLLVNQGQAEEALPHLQKAVRLQPNLPAAHNNLGNAYRALERWEEARAVYATALGLAGLERERPEVQARVHANLGFALQLQNRRGAAIDCFRRAAELAPDDVETWRTLAEAHAAVEDYAAALPCYRRVVELRPEWALAHCELGLALGEEGRLTEAQACYRRALELYPDQLDSLIGLGNLHEEMGTLDQAEVCYRRAREVYPHAPRPLARLAILLRGKLPEPDCLALRQRLDDPTLPPGPRSVLLFGLAQVQDARGAYAEAAACLAEANPLALEERCQQGKLYDPAEHSGLVERIMAGFTPELFARLAGTGDNTHRLVFVFGLPRSGTTLVEQVLASHSRVFAAGELSLARNIFESVPEVVGLPDDMAACLRALNAEDVQRLCRKQHEQLDAILQVSQEELCPPPERIVDKMPDNYLYLGLLALLFPKATFLHVRRDLRDIAVSCWLTNFRSIRWANHPEHIAARIRDHQRLMDHWQQVLPVPVHEVVYERLVDDFETQTRRLLAVCGLEWEPACLRFHETRRPVRTASVTQIRQPLYRHAVAHWKHYESALAELFALLPAS